MRHFRASFPGLVPPPNRRSSSTIRAVTLVGAVRVGCTLLFIGFLAAAATIALTPLPAPAAGVSCGPGASSESAIVAFFDPVSIGAGAEPPAASAGRSQWLAFVSECQSSTDTRMVKAGATLAGAILLGLVLPWAVRRSAKVSRIEQVQLAPPGWYPDPADPNAARWWDGSVWGPLHAPIDHRASTPSHH